MSRVRHQLEHLLAQCHSGDSSPTNSSPPTPLSPASPTDPQDALLVTHFQPTSSFSAEEGHQAPPTVGFDIALDS